MTREEIEAMEPGRELDRLIRIHIFGDIDESWVWKEWWGEHWITDNKEVATWFELPKYSTDISAAWEAWDIGREDEHLIVECKDGEYCATIHRFKQGEESWDVDTWTYSAKTKEEAMMKCRLLAVLEG